MQICFLSSVSADTRETAFVQAITAAGITYAVTKACTMGDLVECSCDKSRGRRYHNSQYNHQRNNYDNKIQHIVNNNHLARGGKAKGRKRVPKQLMQYEDPDGNWEWGGCDDNVNFGVKKSKEFLDARMRRKSDIKTLLRLHNNDAGRLAVKQFMRLECKCHGLSGSCTMRTCWMKMPSFSDVGERLKEHYDGATKVIARNDGHSFMAEGMTIKPPTRKDLVYTDESQDFCRANPKLGSLGTVGRECNITSNGIDGCNLLCCERGQTRKLMKVKKNCRCIFTWCCKVTCETCIEEQEVYTCK
jgi:wingless-type MMTV integration site family protein 6